MRQNFETSLARALEGLPPASHTGLGPDIESALIAVSLACPAADAQLVAAARDALARELTYLDQQEG
ncbi:hypothetical protein [Nocardia sp. NPDC003963]